MPELLVNCILLLTLLLNARLHKIYLWNAVALKLFDSSTKYYSDALQACGSHNIATQRINEDQKLNSACSSCLLTMFRSVKSSIINQTCCETWPNWECELILPKSGECLKSFGNIKMHCKVRIQNNVVCGIEDNNQP